MKLPRLLLVWIVGLLIALSFSLASEHLALAGEPAATPPGEIRLELDEQGLLHLTPPLDSQGVAFSLGRDTTSGQMSLTNRSGRVSFHQPLREDQNRFVLEAGQGQLVLLLPEQGQSLDLELVYDKQADRLVLKAGQNLAVVGAELAGSLTLQAENRLTLGPGSFTVAGDFSLLAGQILQIQDEQTHPLLVQVEGHLTFQGQRAIDIFALNHPASALIAGGDMVLRSPQPVRGDAHYLAGGQFRIEQLDGQAGHLVSPYDPIILASQNVSLGSYTGASLHILAGGSVTLNNVTITGTDAAANTINPANATLFNGVTAIGSLASFNLSDGTPISINGNTQPTLDVRAGVAWGTFAGGSPGNQVIPAGLVPTFGGPVTNANLSVGNITVSPPNGVVLLTNQYHPSGSSGDITSGSINTSTASPGGNGGAILIDSRDNITAGSLNTTANVAGSAASNGGEVRVIAEGNISLGNIDTFAQSGATTAGNGGNVTITAGGTLNNINIYSYVNSVTGSGNAGDIDITTDGPLTLANMQSFSRFSGAGFSGDGGDVNILVQNAGPLDGSDDLHLNLIASDSGTTYSGGAVGPSGNGGNITLVAEDGDVITDNSIQVQTLARGGTNNSGDGGDIMVTAIHGAITIGQFGLNTRTQVTSGSAGDTGQSGDVTLMAEGDIEVSPVTSGGIQADSAVLSGVSQGSGTVLIQSGNGAINFGTNGITIQSFSNGGQAGNTGGITLEAAPGAAGNIKVQFLNAQSLSSGGGSSAGTAGPVLVTGGGNIDLPNGISSSADAQAGTAGNGGDVTITAEGTLNNINITSYVRSATGSGNGGDIDITVSGPLTLGNLQSYSRFTGAGFSGDGGDVSILVKNAGPLDGGDDLHLNRIDSDSGTTYSVGAVGPSGNGGNVSLVAEDGDVITDNSIWVQTVARGGTNNSGNGGDISVTATHGGITIGQFGLNTRTEVTSGSSGNTGQSGDVTLMAEGDIEVSPVTSGGIQADSAVLSGVSQGSGTVLIQSGNGAIDFGTNGITVQSLSNGGQAGNTGGITLEAAGNINVRVLNAHSQSSGGGSLAGSAGPVLVTGGGDINLPDGVYSFAEAQAGTAGNGGNITIQAEGTLASANIDAHVRSATGSGNAGDIDITATGPLTLANMQSYSRFTGTGFSGDGGDVSIVVWKTGPLDGGEGLHVNLIASDSGTMFSVGAVGPSGNGGNVSLVTEDGDVITDNSIWVQTVARGGTNSSGNGGDISVTATNGGITIGNSGLSTRTEVASGSSGNTGQSGDVTLMAEEDIKVNPAQNNGGIQADSRVLSGISQGSGAVLVQSSDGAIDFGVNGITVQSFSNGGQAGNTGGITLEAAGNINVRFLSTHSQSSNGGSSAGTAGPVLVTGGGNINLPNGINSIAEALAGTAGNGGDVTITAGGTLNNINITSYVRSATGSGNGGDIDITVSGPLTLGNLQSYSRFTGAGFSGDAGDVSILVKNAGPLDGGDDLHLNYIWSDSGAWYYGSAVGPSGNGANVSLVTEDGDVIFDNWIWVQTLARGGANNSGNGGDVAITATHGDFSVGNFGINALSEVASGGSGNAGKGGDVTITAAGIITNPTFGGIDTRSIALAGNSSGGGTISLHSTGSNIDFGPNDLISLSQTSSGQAGNGGSITLEAAGTITTGNLRSYSESDSGNAGDAGPVELLADNDIQVTSINATALGGASDGAGGKIVVETNQFFRVTGLTPFTTSIANQGLANSTTITITHGGNGITPFIVGDEATNGTDGAITTGDARLDPTQPYLYTHFEAPNLWIISVPSPLAIDKLVTPGSNVPYHGPITYTLVLSNSSGTPANGLLLTDTLPGPVSFDHWVQQPAGANVTAGQVTWNGTVPATGQVTFSFVASHTGVYNQVVTNTAQFFHPASGGQGSDQATFVVEVNPWLILGPSPLTISKQVTPGSNVPYHGPITYTLVLSNSSGAPAHGMLLTDTLPGPVSFDHWVQQPAGANVTAGQLTWNGTVPATGQVTFSFVASHTGVYNQVVTNTAQFFHPASGGQGSDQATFVVEPDPGSPPPPQNEVYVPILLK